MAKLHDTSVSSSKQLSLVEAQFSNVRREFHQGREVFNLVDIMAQFTTSKLARRLWSDTKRRLKADGGDVYAKIVHISTADKTGKRKQLTDYADGETVLRILQSVPSASVEPIREWLAALGYREITEARNPELAVLRRETELNKLYTAGYGTREEVRKLRARHEGIETLKELKALIYQLCKDARFWQIFNAEYKALFGYVAKELETILETNSIRDSLPLFQLQMLAAGETALRDILSRQEQMTNEQIVETVGNVLRPIGEALRAISAAAGVHPVTGKPLLKSNQYAREDE